MATELSKKILIAEDEKPMAHALELKLGHAGYATKVVHNGADAVEEIKTGQYALVLMDLIMPKMDGFAALEMLKEIGNKTPVFVTSNLGQDEDIARAKSLGAAEYLVKSNTPIAEIVEKVKAFLGT